MKKYRTFVDAESVDHAELRADILLRDGLIKKFVPDLYEFRQVAETMEHRCVPRSGIQPEFNALEKLISQCCMAFELEFDLSKAIAADRGFLKKLLNKKSKELAVVKREIKKAWGIPRIFHKSVNCFEEFNGLGKVELTVE